jgi:allantoicase
VQTKVNFYPNPVSDLLYIESQGNGTIKEIKIYDIYGRVILTKKTSESQIIIDVSGMENGLYILETNNVYSGKIVIQN